MSFATSDSLNPRWRSQEAYPCETYDGWWHLRKVRPK